MEIPDAFLDAKTAATTGKFTWCWLAAWVALRGPLLPALRNE